MTSEAASRTRAVDRRRTAARVEQRDFLLRSLDDLEAEFDAGDLDSDDYANLRADYTKRAATIIRKIESQEAKEAAREKVAWLRLAAWIATVVVVAGFAGFLLAQFSGSRSPGGSITGDIRVSTRELLFEAQQTFSGGDLDGALEVYDEVLDMQPSNVEALTYKGWLTRLQGDTGAAKVLLDDAVGTDPDYPDARVFAAVLAMDLDRPEEAATHLAVLDTLDASPFVSQLVDSMGLRSRIASALDGDSVAAAEEIAQRQQAALDKVGPILMVDSPPPFTETGLRVSEVLDAAEALAATGDLINAVQLVDQVLADLPDDVEALTGRGWLLARTGNAELVEAGEAYLDTALELRPGYPQALVYRAFSRNLNGDTAGARSDLAEFDALDEKPQELIDLLANFGLREALS